MAGVLGRPTASAAQIQASHPGIRARHRLPTAVMSENVAMAANVEQGPTRKYICCVPVEAKENTVTLGSVYGAVVKLLKARGWRRLKSSTQRPGSADLILGGPCGAGIPWKA